MLSLSCTNGLKIEILTDNQSHLSAALLYICRFQGLWVWITKWLSKLFFWHSAQTLPLNYFLSSGRQHRLYDHYILEDTSALYFTGSLFTEILLGSFLTTTSQLPDRGKLKEQIDLWASRQLRLFIILLYLVFWLTPTSDKQASVEGRGNINNYHNHSPPPGANCIYVETVFRIAGK